MIFNNKRSEVEIIYDILTSAREEIHKTRLRYKSNMSHIQFNKYLNAMIDKNLIDEKEEDEKSKIYCLTEDGKELLISLNIVLNRLK